MHVNTGMYLMQLCYTVSFKKVFILLFQVAICLNSFLTVNKNQYNKKCYFAESNAYLMFTVIDYTTQAGFKSLLLNWTE